MPDADEICRFAERVEALGLDPLQVAKTYTTLDHLSGGRRRVIMAVGSAPTRATAR